MFLQAIFPLHLFYSVKLIPLPRKEKYLSLYLTALWKLWNKNNFKETDIREILLFVFMFMASSHKRRGYRTFYSCLVLFATY